MDMNNLGIAFESESSYLEQRQEVTAGSVCSEVVKVLDI
jgi:hypothetical protein